MAYDSNYCSYCVTVTIFTVPQIITSSIAIITSRTVVVSYFTVHCNIDRPLSDIPLSLPLVSPACLSDIPLSPSLRHRLSWPNSIFHNTQWSLKIHPLPCDVYPLRNGHVTCFACHVICSHLPCAVIMTCPVTPTKFLLLSCTFVVWFGSIFTVSAPIL